MKRRIEQTVIYYKPSNKIEAVYNELPDTSDSRWNGAMDWINSIIVSFVILFLLFTFVFRAVGVSGRSMEPTLHNKDWLVITDFKYTAQFGDVVVVVQPNDLNEPIIKRVIGVAGDTIDIDFTSGKVYRNGQMLSEKYVKGPTNLSYDVKFPVTVPEGCVFVLGDNRNNSLDSRSSRIGFVDERYILGKASLRLFPFGDFRIE